jgi:uncharacterized protein (DUF1015 family)
LHTENPAAQFTMMTFINSFSEGLIILPTNRIMHNLDGFNLSLVLPKLQEFFTVTRMENTQAMLKELEETPVIIDKTKNIKNHIFGLYCNQTRQAYRLQLKENNILDQYIPAHTDVYKKLDVNIMHKIIIEKILGITEEMQREGKQILFVKGNDETFRLLADNKQYQLGLFARPPLIREVFLTATANETMPQKATYFYPKVWTGFVLNPLFDLP